MSQPSSSRVSFWRQPLLHFAVIGAVIFAWDAVRPAPPPSGNTIVVTVSQIERMAILWAKTWGRPPTDPELASLIQDHIKEEIYYREAKRLGLDTNDVVIRRRLRQKMEFLSTDSLDITAPDDTILRQYYQDNIDKYQDSTRYTLRHIYYKTNDPARITADLAALNAGANQSDFGDAISLPQTLESADKAQIARLFGSDFYDRLDGVDKDVWTGPLASGYGQHLVRVRFDEDARAQPFDAVKARVETDWKADAKIAAQDENFARLRGDYTVTINVPPQ